MDHGSIGLIEIKPVKSNRVERTCFRIAGEESPR